ncbi:hypothetical protein CYMTET_56814 [Cymbomonas tetramitiformis]|uniref:Uncharacterized protein n=1 Tax=Cymbomonas tetramitiformis TaxID=36881 RepID=A0AAE0BAL5_9CHLO|nr:hypothetical protein CYMTET_56814 [Cymbomonas tetramitiformis]
MEALPEQQAAMMSLMMQQMKDLNARVEVAKETAAKAVSQAGGTAQSGDAELEQLKRLALRSSRRGECVPTRPATLETDMPQMYDLYHDKTYNALSKRTNSSMRYEQLVPVPALSHMHDAIAYSELILDWLQDEKEPPTVEDLAERVYTAHNTLKGVFAYSEGVFAYSEVTLDWLQDEKEPPTVEDLAERVYTAHNTLKGVFALLINRYAMIQLRASMESDLAERVYTAHNTLKGVFAYSEVTLDWLQDEKEPPTVEDLAERVYTAHNTLKGVFAYSEVTLDWLQDEKEPPTVEDLAERVYTAHNTLKGVFALLINRYAMIQLRASMESDLAERVYTAHNTLKGVFAYSEVTLDWLQDEKEPPTVEDLAERVYTAHNTLKGVFAYSEVTLDWLQDEKEPPTVEDLAERVYTAHNTLKGVFALLINRYAMIQLRASMESDLAERVYTAHNTLKGVFALLINLEPNDTCSSVPFALANRNFTGTYGTL